MSLNIVVAVVTIFGVAALTAWLYSIRNTLARERNDLNRAWSDLDLLLKQRYAELPKLIGTCRSYLGEQRALTRLADCRSAYQRAASLEERARADTEIRQALQELFAVADRHPELKLNTLYRQLKSRMTELEQRIAAERVRFNEQVDAFNTRLSKVPNSLVARLMTLEQRPLFQTPESDSDAEQAKLRQ